MPYIITEDGSIKYGDTIEEAKEEWGESAAPEARQRDEYKETPTTTQEPEQEEDKEKTAMFEKGPLAWAEETLVTAGSFITHLPETLTAGTQKLAQSMDPDFWEPITDRIVGDPFGPPMSSYVHDIQARKLGFLKEDGSPDIEAYLEHRRKEITPRNKALARLNLMAPDAEGQYHKFGISEDIPVLGAFSDEGAIHKAFQPETKIGEDISDLGQLIVLSTLMPDMASAFGYAKFAPSVAPGIKLLAKKGPAKKILLPTAIRLAKRIGVALPQDLLEELAFFADPEVDADIQARLDEIFKIDNADAQTAAINLVLADSPSEAEYWMEYGANAVKGMQGAVIFRGLLGGLNNVRRLKKFKGELSEEVIEEAFQKPIEDVTKKVDEVVQTSVQDELNDVSYELNTTFNNSYQDALPGLNQVAEGLSQADDAITKSADELDLATKEADEITGRKSTTELQRITKNLNARTKSLKELQTASNKARKLFKADLIKKYQAEGLSKAKATRLAEAETAVYDKNVGVGKGVTLFKPSRSVVNKITKYQEESAKFSGQLEELQYQAPIDEELLKGPRERGGLAAAQVLSLRAARQSGVNNLIQQIDPLMEQLKNISIQRNELGIDPSEDIVYQSFKRLEGLYDNYKALGGGKRAAGADIDPSLEVTREALERKLLNGIRQEFTNLQDLGSVGGVDLDPRMLKAAAEATEQKVPEIFDEDVDTTPLMAEAIVSTNKAALQAAKKGDDVVKDPSELLEGQRFKAPDVLKPRVNKAGDLEVIADGVPTTVDKQTPIAKLLRMAPKGEQAKIAFERLDEAIKKLEKGMNIPMEERTVINTVGDLVNLLNVGRVAGEEAVQKALRDLDTSIKFLAEVRPIAEDAARRLDAAGRKTAGQIGEAAKALPGKIQDATKDVGDRGIKAFEDDMRRVDPDKADAKLGPEKVEDPWYEDTDQIPLKTNEKGDITTDPDATTKTGVTEEAPMNKAAMLRQAEVMLGHNNPYEDFSKITDEADQIVEASGSLLTREALDEYLNKQAVMEILETDAARKGKKLPYNWSRLATKNLKRAFSPLDTHTERHAALYEALKDFSGKPGSVMPRVWRKVFKYADDLAGAEGGFNDIEQLLSIRRIRRGRSMQGVEEAMVETGAVVLDIAVTGERLYDAVSKLKGSALSPFETKILKLYAAQESLKLYQGIADFMKLRSLAGTFLGSLRKTNNDFLAKRFMKYRAKYKNVKNKQDLLETEKIVDDEIDKFTESLVDEFGKKAAQEAIDEIPNYIGLESNAKTVESILKKFTDPNITPTESDEALFSKIISQLTVAGLNPTNLGSLSIKGDDILYTQMIAGGLSSPKTQLGFPVQTGIYAGWNWIHDALSGKINYVFNHIGWRDPEAMEEAVRLSEITREMQSTLSETYAETLGWIRDTKALGRSIITDATSSIEDIGKFSQSPRTRDPLREQQKLDFLNENSGPVKLPQKGLGRAITEKWNALAKKKGWDAQLTDESAGGIKGKVMLHLMELHDQFYLGDAHKHLGNESIMGKFSKFMYDNVSPQGLIDKQLPKLTNGAITPHQSKFTGGERVGGTLPLTLSETSTEVIGGIYGSAFAKAKAKLQVLGIKDDAGRQMYKRGTEEFNSKVNEIYYNEMLSPVQAGIGDKVEQIAYALNDREAIDLALSFDMMMNPGDDITGKISKGLQDLGRDKQLKLFKAVMTPYVRAPINAAKFHFYYSTPFLGMPVPNGAVFEAGVAFKRLLNGQAKKSKEFAKLRDTTAALKKKLDKTPTNEEIAEYMGVTLEHVEDLAKGDHMGTRIATFESQLFHKDPLIRARAKSALTQSTLFTGAVLGLVLGSDVEISGGQLTSYREAQAADVPPYSIKIMGQWIPYRWTPFLGETLAFAANYRDFQRSNSRFLSEKVVGTAIVASAQTFMDAPAVAGIDTLISAAKNPVKAEQLILQFFEKTGGVRYTALRAWGLRAVIDAYGSRPLISGGRAGMVGKGKTYEQLLEEGYIKDGKVVDGQLVNEETGWWEQTHDLAGQALETGKLLANFPLKYAQSVTNKMGLMTLAETLDLWADDVFDANKVVKGDYRQAHWYQPGDITYTGPNQKSIAQEFLGRHWPVPDIRDEVDREMFRHAIKPPTQVFRKYGIVADEIMVNRFRRYMGSEFMVNGKTTNELFRDLVTDKVDVDGLLNAKYSDLVDNDENSLTIEGEAVLPFKIGGGEETQAIEELYTKRDALMDLRADIINEAVRNFLRGYSEQDDGNGNMIKIPLQHPAPQDAQEQYRRWENAHLESQIN